MSEQFYSVLPIVVLVAAFYLLVIRPQQTRIKKQRELIASLAVGDEILMFSGIYGSVVGIGARTRIRVADGTELEIAPNAIAERVRPAGE